MTTVEDVSYEPLVDAIARRLRGQLGELGISRGRFAALTGWPRQTCYRRLRAETPLDVRELEHIELTVGIPVRWLVSEDGPKYIAPPGALAPRHPPMGLPRIPRPALLKDPAAPPNKSVGQSTPLANAA